MSLSNDLISQFVKVMNSDKKVNKESTVYGTTVEYNGSTYVKLDGSDLLTPVSTTADTKPGERVSVQIKNHTATVTGNITSPAARTGDVKEIGDKITEVEILVADKVSTSQLEAEKGRIDNLVSENVTIRDRLTASEADIDTLQADNATINGKLTAAEANIENLETTKISAEIADAKYATIENLDATNVEVNSLKSTYGEFKDLATDKFSAIEGNIKTLETEKLSTTEAEVKYANIDFANIGKAAVEKFYAVSGIIKDLVIGDTTVTGKLVGVTITGDLIEGGTVKADKLVVLGTDGLYYKLNTDGVSTTTEQTEYNSLNGSVITAKSITAEKVNVKDLVAFDATIGGFNITESSIYSGVKESATNTTRGIYLDKDGQLSAGDSSNFLRYYKDQNGDYKLEISASSLSLKIGGTTSNLETTINGMQTDVNGLKTKVEAVETRVTDAETNIEQNKESIELSATKTEVEEQSNSLVEYCNSRILGALESYVQNGDYDTFKETVTAQLSILANQIEMNFTTTTESINSTNSDMQSRFDELSKYIHFGTEGIEIGSDNNTLKLTLDNGLVCFEQDGKVKGWWDGTDFHTGNIMVDVSEKAQFGNFAFVPRSDGSLMFLKVNDGISSNNLFSISNGFCDFEANVKRYKVLGDNGVIVYVNSEINSSVHFTLDSSKTYKISYNTKNAMFTAFSSSGSTVISSDGSDGSHSGTISGATDCYFHIVSSSIPSYIVRDVLLKEVTS